MVETSSSTTGAKRKLPRLPLVGAVVFLALAMWAASSTTGGALAAVWVYAFLNYYAGVVALVALSLTVMGGLVATDRFFLRIGHRVFFQGLHRATAIIGVVFLGLHLSMKIMEGTATLIDPFVPFANLGDPLWVGLGTVASYLMFSVFWTGIIRARFAGSVRPWLWRTLHGGAYVAWPAALGHGLNAGRPAATWVWLSYGACVVGVIIALLVRLYVTLGRRTTGPKSVPTAVGINMETAVIPRISDAPLRRESDLETTAERIRTSTRETRVVGREDSEPEVAAVAPRSARPAMEPAPAARARDDRGRPAGPRERPAGYAMPVVDEIASPAEERWSEPVVSRAEPEPRRSRSRSGDDARAGGGRSGAGRESRSRYEEEPERRSRSAASRERERERVEEPRDRRGRTQVGRRRSEEKRGLTQWRRRERAEEKRREADEDREWYESLRTGQDEAVEPVSAERYSPTSAEPWTAPERSEQAERYRRSERAERSERAAPESRRADRWTSPADERYGEAPVSAPAARYDEPRYEESRYEEPRYEESRYEESRYDDDRAEERPRRLLRLVTDDEAKPSRRSRHSVDEQPEERSRARRRSAEYDAEPGYGRPGPYPPAVDPAPSRRARRSAPDAIDSSDRPRRGRRAAGGEDLDVGDGAYWTRPREGYGR